MNYWFLYTLSTGAIYGQPYKGYADEWTNIPSGCGVLGPIDESDPTGSDAYQNPEYYTVQNGQLVNTATAAQLLAQSQASQLASINAGYASTMAGGFQSNATGTSDTYAIDTVSMGKWTGTLAIINAGIGPSSVTVKDISGNKVTLTASEFKQFALDGFNFFNAQEQQLWALEDQIDAQQEPPSTPVTWTPGAYTPQPAPSA